MTLNPNQTTYQDRHQDWNTLAIVDFDEAFVVGASYANALVVDARIINDSVFTFYKAGGDAIEYTVFGSAYVDPTDPDTAPADSHNSWVNILDLNSVPANYDHTESKTIPSDVNYFYESRSNRWAWVRLQIKSTTTPTVKVYHRGTQR